jgi:selenium metabolism protein YedF
MTIVELDVRGLPCPEPIVRAKRALFDERRPAVRLRVDSRVTRDNLEKFAATKKLDYHETQQGEEWEITLTAREPDACAATIEQAAASPPVVLCTRATFGAPSGELGTILIRAFFKTLLEVDRRPSRVIFINEGVKLACADEAVIDYCGKLAQGGVEVISCGTCLDYFGLLQQLKVGRVGNMFDIASALLEAGHVVEP